VQQCFVQAIALAQSDADTALDEEVKTTSDATGFLAERTSCVRVAVGLKHTIAAQYPLTETDAMSSNQDD
jgi:predicted S18 family serine protease